MLKLDSRPAKPLLSNIVPVLIEFARLLGMVIEVSLVQPRNT